jgi:hypothetical protein
MAKVSSVKDSSYPQNLLDPFGRRIALAEIEPRLQGQNVRHLSPLPPEFNSEQPSHTAQWVVVELAMDESPGRAFTRTGHDLSQGGTPIPPGSSVACSQICH